MYAFLCQIAEDFGIADTTLHNWLKRADVDVRHPTRGHDLRGGRTA